MFKKGELTTQQIVILIILVVSFAIILFFLFKLNLGKQTDQDICHNSVITRGKSILPTDTFPLQCKRQYVCLSVDGTCESMTKPEVIKVKTQDDVYKALADQLAQCWWMFGEGKINYVGADTIPKLYCSICSQIAFDDSVKKVFPQGELNKESLYNYMEKNKTSEKDVTYLSYLYGVNDLSGLKTKLSSNNLNFGKINLDKQYYSLMGITSDVNTLGWAASVGGVALAVAFTPLVGGAWGLGVGLAVASGTAGGVAGSLISVVIKGVSGKDYISPSLIEPNSPEMKALNCQEISTSS